MTLARSLYQRFRQLLYEFIKFGVVGVIGLLITNAVYGLCYLHLGLGPVTSATIATVVAAVATYLGNRYWSFRTRERSGVVREAIIFVVLNGVGLLIQDATVAFHYYVLHLGNNKLAGFIALNSGIALATLFRFWSYRRFVWVAPSAGAPGGAGRGAQRDTERMSEHAHGPGRVFDAGFWDERYRSASRVWSGNPNPQLVAEVAGLPPGRALDVGCGEGADAIWLARRGWAVVAADISGVALERAARHARDTDPAAAARIEWRQADLLATPPEPGAYDLVSAQFIQLPPAERTRLFSALAAAVRDGGMLLVVGHHPSDLAAGVPRPPMPELFYTPDEIAGLLGGRWQVRVREARPRQATTPDGVEVTIHDTVLAATRRGQPAGAGQPSRTNVCDGAKSGRG